MLIEALKRPKLSTDQEKQKYITAAMSGVSVSKAHRKVKDHSTICQLERCSSEETTPDVAF